MKIQLSVISVGMNADTVSASMIAEMLLLPCPRHVAVNRLCSLLQSSLSEAIFTGKPGLAGFIEAKDDGGGGDNWSYKTCKAPIKSSPPTNQHPTFLQATLQVAQPTVSEH